jgi:hypothetical protein
MSENMRLANTVGELRAALEGLDDSQPIDMLPYSEEDGAPKTLVVLDVPGGRDVRWVFLLGSVLTSPDLTPIK